MRPALTLRAKEKVTECGAQVNQIRVGLIGLGLAMGIGLNTFVAPQLMTPRPPVFNGPDIAENWEWRSMAIYMHAWWLWEQFPDATVTHVGFIPPPGHPELLPVGMKFSGAWDPLLGLAVDLSSPPLDLSGLDVRDELFSHRHVYSRIHCRVGQEMEVRDTCYYFVAWDPALLSDNSPEFVGIELNRTLGEEEMALVERSLLEAVASTNIENLSVIDEVVD